MPKVRYIGQYDEVVVVDGQVEKVCARGDVIDVSDTLAHGRPAVVEDRDGEEIVLDGAVGGLLEQTDNWELVKDPKAKAPTGQEGDDQ